MKKLLDFDWLRTVQFKCNSSAYSVTLVQITKTKKNKIFQNKLKTKPRNTMNKKRKKE